MATTTGTASQDAAALRAAAAVLRRRFGGLATAIAILDSKAAALETAGAEGDDPR